MVLFWTAVAAVAASIYTWLTYRLVRGQSEPKVVVYACTDPDRETIIMIRIANIGRDVPTDVRFTTSRVVPVRAYGISAEEVQPAEEMKDGPLGAC